MGQKAIIRDENVHKTTLEIPNNVWKAAVTMCKVHRISISHYLRTIAFKDLVKRGYLTKKGVAIECKKIR